MLVTDDRSDMRELEFPTEEQFAAGVRAFKDNECRADVYFRASTLISDQWGSPSGMASGVKILLDVWHLTFYRFGNFDVGLLTDCIKKHLERLGHFRGRAIENLTKGDHEEVAKLFDDFLDALRGGKRRSPVAVAKALHLFSPTFFPLWDSDIAIAYGSWWVYSEFGSMEYLPFSWKMKRFVQHVTEWECVRNPVPTRSVLKLIDEYNYSRFTKSWI